MKKEFEGLDLEKMCREFGMNGEYLGYDLLTDGHINKTLKVYVQCPDKMRTFILQRLNTYVFKKPKGIMSNIISVTEFLRAKMKADGIVTARRVLHYCKTEDGLPYVYDGDGGFWRAYRCIDDSEGINLTDDLAVIEESGKAFGEFQRYLLDYEADKLFIAIPHFHNTVNRYRIFKEAIKNDFAGRRGFVEDLIGEYLSLEDLATQMYVMQKSGELKLRVTHNDTKSNNVLFDIHTHEHLAVIDLDTVMPGLCGFDFGDAIRFTANAAAEDEKDLSLVGMRFEMFEALLRGYLSKAGAFLNPLEKELLPFSGKLITLEIGIRFLTDYLDGDTYFKTKRPGHNLDRCRTQLKLVESIESQLDAMRRLNESIK